MQFGKYLLLERIAVGGMAEVFAAKAFGVEGFERVLAIKKILPTMGEDPEFVSMFVDEARIAVQLSHANIVQVLELGKHDENLYIAMEYISGRDVRQLVDRYRRRGEPLPLAQACTIVARACEALDYAHRKRDASGKPLGIVHRDVSPQNVLVSFDGDVKLIDFGIAKAETRLQNTQSGILKGKFSYMSPEQVRGHPIDRRSDIFAAGVLLWELLCGRKLFSGESDFAVLEKVRKGDVPPPRSLSPHVPERLERVVLRALATEPRDRYQWCSELHDDLAPFAMVGGAPLGSRRLADWMREEFRPEHEKEQARLQRWLGPGPRAAAEGGVGGAGGAGTAAGAGRAGSVALPERTQQWHLARDADTIVQPPTPTGARTSTRMLREHEAGAQAFDNSGELTAAQRKARRGALTRPARARAAGRGRLLTVVTAAVAVGLTAVAVVGYVVSARGRLPSPKVAVTVNPAAPALQVEGLVLSARPEPPVRHPEPPVRDPEPPVRDPEPPAQAAEPSPQAAEPRPQAAEPPPRAPERESSERGGSARVSRRIAGPPPGGRRAAAAEAPMPVEREAAPPAQQPAAEQPVVAVRPKRATARSEPAAASSAPAAASSAPAAASSAPAAASSEPAVANEARFHVMSEPIGARIRLSGRIIGRAPLTTEPLPLDGQYELAADLEGYVSVRRAVKAVNGVTDVTLALPIQPIAGTQPIAGIQPAVAEGEVPAQRASAQLGYLVTNTRPVARVTIDGRETGRWTPVPEANPIALPAGAHTVVFETADGQRHEEMLQIEPGKTARLVRELASAR